MYVRLFWLLFAFTVTGLTAAGPTCSRVIVTAFIDAATLGCHAAGIRHRTPSRHMTKT